MKTITDYRKICYVLFPLLVIAFHVWPASLKADDHQGRGRRYQSYKSSEHYGERDGKRARLKREDEGNEVTGQTAAWLLVAANLSVVLSILLKRANRYFSLMPDTKNSIVKFNRFQKQHLMRFHYILNPIALGIATLHFLLSSCRRSPLPEWGLICLAAMVLLGFTVKFKLTPKPMKRFVYNLHTGWPAISIMTLLLVVGHMIID